MARENTMTNKSNREDYPAKSSGYTQCARLWTPPLVLGNGEGEEGGADPTGKRRVNNMQVTDGTSVGASDDV